MGTVSNDDVERISRDMATLNEFKKKIKDEKSKTNKIHRVLTSDSQQFKKDYNELRLLQKGTSEYEERRKSLKQIKKILDQKVNNINQCIAVINKSEHFLTE